MLAGGRPEDTLVIAHRGAWGRYPQNSLEAFEEAVRVGTDMIELDVRRTVDGHLIAHHDPVWDRRYDELTAPLLYEVVVLLGRRVALNLELKERGCEAEVATLLGRAGVDHCLISSFLDDVVHASKTHGPWLQTGLVVEGGSTHDASQRAWRCRADCLILESELVAAARPPDGPSLVWTVNDVEAIDRCLSDPAIAGVITDRPGLALKRRALLSGRTALAMRS